MDECDHKVLSKKEAGDWRDRRQCDKGSKRLEESEEGTMSLGTQAASRSWKRQRGRFFPLRLSEGRPSECRPAVTLMLDFRPPEL